MVEGARLFSAHNGNVLENPAVRIVTDDGVNYLRRSRSAYDAVISDMAPKTSGIRSTDEARSLRLAGKALELAVRRGRPGASFVAKLFMGGDFESFRDELRSHFEDVKVVRPEATRGASVEVYLVGLRLKPTSTSTTRVAKGATGP